MLPQLPPAFAAPGLHSALLSIGKSKGLFHRRRVLPCRPPCATGSHLPAVLPSARPARPPDRPRAAGAGSQAQTARRQGWFKRLELAVAKELRGERLIQTHAV